MRLIGIALLATTGSAAQPGRIVSAAPSITEMLFAIGAGDRVVGVTNYCHYPPEAVRLPKVGGYSRPNLEAVAALRPDLVVLQKSPGNVAAGIEQLGIRTLELDHNDVAGVYRSIQKLGAATGNEDRATALIRRIRADLDGIGKLAARMPRRRVTFIVGRTPGAVEGLTAVGGGTSYLHQLLSLAGGDNIFAASPVPYPRVSLEEIFARDPEVLIDMGAMGQTEGIKEARTKAVLALWGRHSALAAVREHRVYAVASDIFVVPGPRMVDAAREFLRMIHPEVER